MLVYLWGSSPRMCISIADRGNAGVSAIAVLYTQNIVRIETNKIYIKCIKIKIMYMATRHLLRLKSRWMLAQKSRTEEQAMQQLGKQALQGPPGCRH